MRGIFSGGSGKGRNRKKPSATWLAAAVAAAFVFGIPAESRADDHQLVILGGGGGGGAHDSGMAGYDGVGGDGGSFPGLPHPDGKGGNGDFPYIPGISLGGKGGDSIVYFDGTSQSPQSGNSAVGPDGGSGAGQVYTRTDSSQFDYIAVVGGDAGSDGYDSGLSTKLGSGGLGGAASFFSNRNQSITGDGLYLHSGASNPLGSVKGGDAKFDMSNSTLSIYTDMNHTNVSVSPGAKGAVLDLVKGDGAGQNAGGNLKFQLHTLDIDGQYAASGQAMATLNISRGAGGSFTQDDQVVFDTLRLANGGIFKAGKEGIIGNFWGQALDPLTKEYSRDFVFNNLVIQGAGNELRLNHYNNLSFGLSFKNDPNKGLVIFDIPDIAGRSATDPVSPATTLLTMGHGENPADGDRARFNLVNWSPDKLLLLMGNEKPQHLKPGQVLTLIDGVYASASGSPFDSGVVYGRGGGYGLTFTEMTVRRVEGAGVAINVQGNKSDVLDLSYDLSSETANGKTYSPYGQAQLATLSLITSISEENLKSLGLFRKQTGTNVNGGGSGGGGHTHTGCNIDLTYYSFALGLSHGWETPLGLSSIGAFFETGKSDYDTDIYMKGLNRWLKGSGDTKYWGGGSFWVTSSITASMSKANCGPGPPKTTTGSGTVTWPLMTARKAIGGPAF